MTRVLSYNILAGGYSLQGENGRRVDQLLKIIRSTQPDVVGLVEAINPRVIQKPPVVEELAEQLGMQLIRDENAMRYRDYQPAVLTRLPLVRMQAHARPGRLTRPLLEVCVEESNGQHLTIFVTHLAAAFNQGWAGNAIRQREVREILHILDAQREQGTPHLLMGDFNSLAPGDPFRASSLLDYVIRLDHRRRKYGLMEGHPHLEVVVPRELRFLNPLLEVIPQSRVLRALFDVAANFYVPRGSISLLHDAGYVDCYRRIHPRASGFTCPAAAPAGRIDFIFADPTLAKRLESCYVVTEGEGLPGSHASDHLAVAAEFGVGTQAATSSTESDSASLLTKGPSM